MTRLSLRLAFLAALFLTATLSTAIPEANAETNPAITAMANSANVEVKQFGISLSAKARPISRLRKMRYTDLKSYYRNSFRSFAQEYPARFFTFNPEVSLQSYRGTKQIEVPEVHKFPFMPISSLAYDERKIRFAKLVLAVGDKKVFGLQARSPIAKHYKKLPPKNRLDEFYMPDVNARAMGFTHAQLILPLSKNVEPGPMFDYNGFRQWSQHGRYKRMDQVSRPIALTNYAHQAGAIYAISDHPDFSLSFLNIDREAAKMTIFLWDAKKHKNKQLGEVLPDFVFQFVFEPN